MPDIAIKRVFAKPDAARLRDFAEDLRDGSFRSPVSDRLPLRKAAIAHERGGGGKIVLVIGGQNE